MSRIIRLAFVFWLAALACSGWAYAQPMKFYGPRKLPENTFIYAGYEINTKEFAFGVSPKRNGGHWMIADRLRGGAPIPMRGEGSVVGFGIYREGTTIFIGPGSLKAAGSTGTPDMKGRPVNTVNPQLPFTNSEWEALMPEEYASEVLNGLVDITGLRLEVDSKNPFESVRFPFNFEKHGSHRGYLTALERGTYWLGGKVHQANQRIPWYHQASGYYVDDLYAFDPEETIHPDVTWHDKYPKNMAQGYLNALDQYFPDRKPKPLDLDPSPPGGKPGGRSAGAMLRRFLTPWRD